MDVNGCEWMLVNYSRFVDVDGCCWMLLDVAGCWMLDVDDLCMLPSGKHTKNLWKITMLSMGKST